MNNVLFNGSAIAGSSSLGSADARGLTDVQYTGTTTLVDTTAVQAAHVRLHALPDMQGQPARVLVELYTPCAYAEFFGWQPGRGLNLGTYTGMNLTGTDWTLVQLNTQPFEASQDVTALTGPGGLAVTYFSTSYHVLWFIQKSIDLTIYDS